MSLLLARFFSPFNNSYPFLVSFEREKLGGLFPIISEISTDKHGLPLDDFVGFSCQSEELAFRYTITNLKAISPPTNCTHTCAQFKGRKKEICKGDLKEDKKMSTAGTYRWGYRCNSCKSFDSFWKGTVFQDTHIPTKQIMFGVLNVLRKLNHEQVQGSSNLSNSATTDFYEKVHFVILNYYRKLQQHDKMIGGYMKVVQIDESKFGKNKYGAGRPIAGCWIFGGVDDDNNKFFMPVAKRDEDTLLPLLLQFVKPGSIIMSDYWGAYRTDILEAKGFYHVKVNHTVGWKEVHDHKVLGEITACTNKIEGVWNGIKMYCPVQHMNFFDMEMELAIYWFRSTHSDNIWAAFWYAFHFTTKEEFLAYEKDRKDKKEMFRRSGKTGRPVYTRAQQTRDHRAGQFHHETCACSYCEKYWADNLEFEIEQLQKQLTEIEELQYDRKIQKQQDEHDEYSKYIEEIKPVNKQQDAHDEYRQYIETIEHFNELRQHNVAQKHVNRVQGKRRTKIEMSEKEKEQRKLG